MTPARAALRAIPDGIERWSADDRAAWLARRQADVTASVAGALLGIHDFTTLYGLWCLKAGLLTEDPEESAPMRRGRLLEPIALHALREDTGWHIEPAGFYYRDPIARIGATPDAFAIDREQPGFGVVQVKSVEPSVFRTKWKTEDGTIEPPLWITVQAILEATLSGASWAVVAPLVVGHGVEVHAIPVPLHAGVMTRLRTEVAKFWRSVDANEPPDPDYAADGATIAGLWSDDNGMEIDLTADARLPQLAAERDELKIALKAATDRVAVIDAEFKHRLGPNEAARLADGRRATWRTELRRQRFQPAGEVRTLRISSSNRSL